MAPSIIRTATQADAGRLAPLIANALAAGGVEPVRPAAEIEASIAPVMAGPAPIVEALLAETEAGLPCGFVLFYTGFSTVTMRPGFVMLDIFVEPEYRQAGLATRLMQSLAGLAVARGYLHVLWSVQDGNSRAIRFYERLGALPLTDTSQYALAGNVLLTLARGGQ